MANVAATIALCSRHLELTRQICDRARRSHDARFDGRFFIAVTTTRVYCRPVCPVRAPKDDHIRYFPTAAAAEAAGFRPCLRCRPEASPGTPAWLGTSAVVSRALRLIGEGSLDEDGVDALAGRLGMTARHLRRLFLQHLGATPVEVAHTRRVHFAKKLLDETALAFSQVAFASGFGSVRRFNSQIRRTYARTRPSCGGWRCQRRRGRVLPFRLAYHPPCDWAALRPERARPPGIESVEQSRYRRTITVDGARCHRRRVIRPGCAVAGVTSGSRALLFIVDVWRVFDLGADPAVIAEHLRADPLLRKPLARHPGIRVAGAWDGFELAVRAILGQQVSVRAATTIAGRLASMFGTPVADARGLSRLFPTPAQLQDAALERAGVMPARAAAIRSLARQVADRRLALGPCIDGRATIATLTACQGIGDWTAEYIAMRALGEPDAFPRGDLVLRRLAGGLTARALDRRSDAWRPWRAYAAMLLWQQAVDDEQRTGRMRHAEPEDRSARHDGDDRGARLVAADGAR
jgi:AraC family transcriptional regulator of adaptative response / DNA-3-methyladenine glycosylase II